MGSVTQFPREMKYDHRLCSPWKYTSVYPLEHWAKFVLCRKPKCGIVEGFPGLNKRAQGQRIWETQFKEKR